MLDQFQAAAEAVGAIVKRFSLLAEAAAYVRETAGPTVAAADLSAAILQELSGITFASPDDYRHVRTGLSCALAGVAATGSLLLDLSDPVGRSATALPPVHMVFLRSSAIVADLKSLEGTLDSLVCSRQHSYLSLTTGPSRTADIERVLTIGVHGPKELHILVVEGA